jgi:hypothetical protein
LQFDLATGAPFDEEKYAQAAQRVESSSRDFLEYAKNAVGIPKTRGWPLLIPAVAGLIDLSLKLNSAVKAANAQRREMVVKSLEDKKWKRFNELNR